MFYDNSHGLSFQLAERTWRYGGIDKEAGYYRRNVRNFIQTNSMEHNSSWEANSHSASQEILRIYGTRIHLSQVESSPNPSTLFKVLKSRRITWAGHATYKGQMRNA